MAPELFKGKKATVQSDIYSYGTTFYQLATGNPPFVATDIETMCAQHRKKPPNPISFYRKSFPKSIDHIIVEKCMAKRPEKRPKSMSKVVDKLNKQH